MLAESDGSGLVRWVESYGSSPWLLALALIIATFISEDLACITGGILAAKGLMTLEAAIAACAVGIWVGDVVLYGIGYVVGHKRKHWRWMDRLVTEERVARGRHLFDVYGMGWVFASRFLPGMRLPSYVAAGVVGWPFRKFVFALAVGAWIWTPVLCGLAFYAGRAVLEWVETYQKWAWPILIGATLALWIGVQTIVPLFTWRGRRLLRSRWLRIRHWEFWPLWAVYPPVVLVLLWQALRLRGATLFTCCDPAIPHSGFALESKVDILDQLAPPDPGCIRVARYLRLTHEATPGRRMEAVKSFLASESISYPVVLKPDVGERGQGVAIIESEQEARRWLDAYHGPAMVQEYVEGLEFGVQWLRRPAQEHGELTSIAGKHLQYVTGDGKRTLEHLILSDRRAVTMASYYLAKFEGQLERVLDDGERFCIANLGTHARGAVFTDERSLATPELVEVFDRLAQSYPGFHFGRYDIRVPSVEDFQSGRGLVVLELNGVTGEPVHVYSPGYSWWKGTRDLCRHWIWACEIGAANRKTGAKPTSLRALWALIRLHRKHHWFEADDLLGEREDG